MRAREPDSNGYIIRDGVSVYYEVYGDGDRTLLLLPPWAISHSRVWKGQIPELSRRYRVVAFDGRGNGRSDRPKGAAAYHPSQYVADALAVLDATGAAKAVAVGVSFGGHLGALLAANHPDRVEGAILMSPTAPFGPNHPYIRRDLFLEEREDTEGWAKFNGRYWLRDYPDFAAFFLSELFPEPHSTRQIEEALEHAAETSGEVLLDTVLARVNPEGQGPETYRKIRCPVLVIHGDQDRFNPPDKSRLVAELTGGRFVLMPGAGHVPMSRFPIKVNRMIRAFVDELPPRKAAAPRRRAESRRAKRALYLSSPIGLGHARRDLGIAHHLRDAHPGLEIDWLAQHPVTAVLEAQNERIHPASRWLVSESAHLESEGREHELRLFEAYRRMDEILVANFSVLQDVVEEGRYDLVIADEAWELDHFWHEHPELKRAPLAWLTDFVGMLPMPEGGEREAALVADYNAEMLEHVTRFPDVRDRAIFVGDPDDIVPRDFGPNLPSIRDWTERRFAFSGYITGFDPALYRDRAALRAELGYRPDERVCIAAVGGSSLGTHLLRRVIEAFPMIRRRLPDLRLIAVAGPRIDPARLPAPVGVEVRAYVPDLHRHLAACDLAIVQGGLATCMELVAMRRPFIYVPLQGHFEQNFHVRHRLERHSAGRCLEYASADPDTIAAAVIAEFGRPVAYREIPRDGAERAARLILDLL